MPPASWLRLVGRWPTLLLRSAFSKLEGIIQALMIWVVSAGPIPSHIAFIMDGNRRFADRLHVDRHIGHSHGYDALLRTLKDCFDLQVKTVTLFAFSIDNFHRPPDEVSALMDLMQTKLETLVEKEGLASEYGIQVRVLGDLSLLPHGTRMAAEKAMAVTSQNSSAVLNLCISYTSTHEIVQSIQRTCDNVLTALTGDDGSQGSVVMCKCKKADTHAIGNCNGHAVWSHTARHGCGSNCDHNDMDGSDEQSMSYSCNRDYDCSNGSRKERDGGVSNGDSNCVNAYCSTEDVHGGYSQCKICVCAYANGNCNGWNVHRLVDMNHRAYAFENGLSRICDEAANNNKPEVSSKEITAANSTNNCNNIRASQVSLGDVVQGDVVQSVGLRNRTYKKEGVSANSIFQDPHSVSICDRDPKQSEGTISGEDNGYAKKAQTASKSGGSLIRELACDSFNMACYKCKTRSSQRCSSGLNDSDSFGKLRYQQYQFNLMDTCVNGTIRKDDDVMKEGLSNCNCGKHCYLNDRIIKIVKDCISEEQIERHLYTEPCPPPDLLIRTSGETRLSNFLLWQTSFSHLAFCKVLWPEFSFRHLFFIILEYQRAFPSLLRKRQYCNIAWRKNQ